MLQRVYGLFFIDLDRRKVFLAGVTAHPVGPWVTELPPSGRTPRTSVSWRRMEVWQRLHQHAGTPTSSRRTRWHCYAHRAGQ
jgi:hypothetical protein